MVQVVGVRFKKAGKVYYFDPAEFPVQAGGKVVVETARGVEYGDVAVGPKDVEEEQVVQPLKKVLRVGTDRDAITAADNKRKEREAFAIAQKKIETHNLEMNLVDVEYTFDGSKNIFYFTAEGRVDFRDLVRDLAAVFRTRIEMRQIGVRDEAKLLGGIGPCGRILCCSSFLGDFAPVSIRMAKDQNLSLNPSKISGLCGRLMCCLRYEQDTYEAAKKDPTLAPGYMPPVTVSLEPANRELEELDERPKPRIAARPVGESGVSVRVAQAAGIAERPQRREEPGEPRRMHTGRPAEQARPAGRPTSGGGQGAGQPRQQGPGGPRREQENRPPGDRNAPQHDRRPAHAKGSQGQPKDADPARAQQQGRPPQGNQPRRPQSPGPDGPRRAGDRPQGAQPQAGLPREERPQVERPQTGQPREERPQGDRPQGDRPPRHRHHRGNRNRGSGERPQGEPTPPS